MVNFVVDSTFGITREFARENNIKVVSLTLTLGGKEYVEGYREDWTPFYSEYSRSRLAAGTSQPSPDRFATAISEFLEEDPDGEIIIFTIGDRLSGTIGSARIAVSQFEGKNVTAIDSHNAGVSAFVFLREMLKARAAGMNYEELITHAESIRDRFSTKFVPASLTELARSGRVNKLLSRIGNILNIKPVFEYAKNELSVIGKVLGTKRAMQLAIDSLPKYDEIAICYIHDDALVEPLKDKLFRTFGMSHIDVIPYCPVAGAHIGIGTVGIVIFESKDK